jgi:hypothetical protein
VVLGNEAEAPVRFFRVLWYTEVVKAENHEGGLAIGKPQTLIIISPSFDERRSQAYDAQYD